MKIFISLVLFFFSHSLFASILERPVLNYNRGVISVKSEHQSQYRVGQVESVTPKAGWNNLNRRQVAENATGQLPYRVELHSSSSDPNDMVIMEGAASLEGNNNSEAELVISEFKNKELQARTRCRAKHSTVTQAKNDLGSLGNIFDFEINIGDVSLTHETKNKRDLLDCTTVTPSFCAAIDKGVSSEQMKNCLSMMSEITKQYPAAWNQLQQKEQQLTNNWLFPFSENFFGNVSGRQNERGEKKSLDVNELRKRTEMTDKDTQTFVNLARDCEVFNYFKSPVVKHSNAEEGNNQSGLPERSAAGKESL